MPPDLSLEAAAGRGAVVLGVDEVGRGPLAGPVVAAAAWLGPRPAPALLALLDDSKRLTARRRDLAAARLTTDVAVAVEVAEASVAEIDRDNVLNAALTAMSRAVAALAARLDDAPDLVLVDGNRPPALEYPVRAVVKGDARSASIAAASIVAKVHRDRIMAELSREWPGYGWERNAGYGTAEHLDALYRLGPTPHHRRSFRPVSELIAIS